MKPIRALFIVAILGLVLALILVLRADTDFVKDYSANVLIKPYNIKTAKKLSSYEKKYLIRRESLILYDPENMEGLKNIENILEDLSIDYQAASYENSLDISRFQNIILIDKSSDAAGLDEVGKYVENGGKALYLGESDDKSANLLKMEPDFFGIKTLGTYEKVNEVVFESEILLGMRGTYNIAGSQTESQSKIACTKVSLKNDAKIHMKSSSGSPILWELSQNKGKLMVLNMGKGQYGTIEARGLIVGALGTLNDLFLYPIINSEVIYIEDSSLVSIKEDQEILHAYGRNFDQFTKDIWWADMFEIMRKYNLKYTAAFIKEHDNDRQGTFAKNKDIAPETLELARSIIRSGGEVSLFEAPSGLATKNQNSNSQGNRFADDYAETNRIHRLVSDFNNHFPNYKFYTYMTNSDNMNLALSSALKKSVPSLNTLSRPAYEDKMPLPKMNHRMILANQEANGIDAMIDLPRISKGMIKSDNDLYKIASSMTSLGLISHFISTEDLLNLNHEKGILWDDLYEEVNEYMGVINGSYPWVDKMTSANTAQKIKQIYYSKIYYHEKDGRISISCDNFSNELSLILKTDKKILAGEGCEFKKIATDRYLVKMKNYKATLEVEQ